MAATKHGQTRVKPRNSNTTYNNSYIVWGLLATFAVIVTTTLISFGLGTRGSFNAAQISTLRPPDLPIIQKSTAATDFEIARLNTALRALTAERERLNERVALLEQSVGDITASISPPKESPAAKSPDPAPPAAMPQAAQPAPVPASPAPATILAAADPAPSMPPAAQNTLPPEPSPALGAIPDRALEPSAPVPPPPPVTQSAKPKPAMADIADENSPARTSPVGKVVRSGQFSNKPPSVTTKPVRQIKQPSQPSAITHNVPTPRPSPIAESKGPPTQVAQILQPPVTDATSSIATRTEFGVDLGGDISMDGLRARWANIKGNHGTMLNGLQPLVQIREGSKPGTVELHLIAGPIPNAGSAARVCANLQNAGVGCQTSEYDGQKLSFR